MDKKKVGELEGTPIVIGKKNYANEHEYYLTMNEDNTYQKMEQRVAGDKFRTVLGGGGQVNDFGNTKNFGVVENMTEEEIAIFMQNNPGISAVRFLKLHKDDLFATTFLYEPDTSVFAGFYSTVYSDGPLYRNQSDGKWVKVVINSINVALYSPDAEERLVQVDSVPDLSGLSSDWLYGFMENS